MELKPCPFCGGKANITQISHGYNHAGFNYDFELKCARCGVDFGREESFAKVTQDGRLVITKDGYMELVKKWNRRVEE